MITQGNCYKVAVNLVVEDYDLTLAHGTVIGQGALKGVPFEHAWVETLEGMVIDKSNGLDVYMPAAVYYGIGRISNVRRYKQFEAIYFMTELGHYGPWEANSNEREGS